MKWIKNRIGKRWRLLVIAGFLCSSLLLWARWRPAQRFDFSSRDADELRLVTWNVGYFSVAPDKNVRETDLKPIADKIKASEADIVCLQELGDLEHPQKIVELLGGSWSAKSVKTGHGNQVVSILSQLPCLSEGEHRYGGRMVKAVTLKQPNGQELIIIGIHSPHPIRGMSETEDNVKGALELGKELCAKRPDAYCFVLGDTNFNFDLESDFYCDVCQHYGDGTRDLGKTYYAQTRIDHFFHFPKNLPVVTEESGLIDLNFRLAPVPGHRDHRPIVVTYRLNP